MKDEKKYELPILSSELFDVMLTTNGVNVKLELISHFSPKNIVITFNRVLSYKFTAERFTYTMDAYDKIVEIKKSNWLTELKKINTEDFDFWDLKHYAIYFDSKGLYQFIAESFSVNE